ncbi:helix-turn-helix transcriptional regulator [Dyadobacter sp. CY312]|uniref:helix-turn-helix transcriptional regulator n=1 Tax=Dyadobacter sp. CY312 TaxID=2907303 RepID=UPI001F157C8E|nr:helix-turn-helix transcriptional regulator [Dyadobacter sp. CY312]MCE7039450.1 helix-turn-helix domain-containing protein [Dyadobacter sp. CY312]
MSIVSNNIKYLRKLNGMTQEQFAQRIEIKRSLLGAYEEARANPNLTNLENMAEAFGITVDNLLKNDFQKLKEKPELKLPFNASRPMTVSHSGVTPSPTRKPAYLEPEPKTSEKYQAQNNVIPESPQNINLESQRTEFRQTVPQPNQVNQIPPVLRSRNASNQIETNQIPVFNNQFSPSQQVIVKQEEYPTIQWVSQIQQSEYLTQCHNPLFLVNLPSFQLPNLPAGYYRAFESGADFAFPGALLVGNFVRNWYEIKTGGSYVFVILNQGVLYRKSKSAVNDRGLLTLSSDVAGIVDMHVTLQDVLEVWEVKAFVSHQLPVPSPSVERIGHLVNEIQKEISHML